jgi:arabinose-5-phosphate isomerase
MGDALAVALLVERGFKAEDFALFHPGGSLGKRLLLKVEDLMHSGEAIPLVGPDTLMSEALFVITAKRLGIVGVTDGRVPFQVLTDVICRAPEKGINILDKTAGELMRIPSG